MPDIYSLGLLGYPLGHSLSPQIHAAALRACGRRGEYLLFPVKAEKDIPELISKVRDGSLQGLNVTIPYKRLVIEFMDEITTTARSIGAVNTISRQGEKLVGENTDAGGFLADLNRLNWFHGSGVQRRALILGAGGSARAIAYAMVQQGWQVTITARRPAQAEQLAQSLADTHPGDDGDKQIDCLHWDLEALAHIAPAVSLIVNTTPLGMTPQENVNPWPAGLPLPLTAAVYDLVYNPAETRLTRAASARGLQAASGIGMLVEQAALSFEIWTGLPAPRIEMHAAVAAHGSGAK